MQDLLDIICGGHQPMCCHQPNGPIIGGLVILPHSHAWEIAVGVRIPVAISSLH
jgi:hypothetical protein